MFDPQKDALGGQRSVRDDEVEDAVCMWLQS